MSADLQEERLPFWDRLIRGEPVSRDEVDRTLSCLSHDAPDDERWATVLLLAAVRIATEGSRAMRKYLQAGLVYWFSQSEPLPNAGEGNARQLRSLGLVEVKGLQLSWPQALRAVGIRVSSTVGINYVALRRLEDALRERMEEEWKRVFGTEPPGILRSGR